MNLVEDKGQVRQRCATELNIPLNFNSAFLASIVDLLCHVNRADVKIPVELLHQQKIDKPGTSFITDNFCDRNNLSF